MKVSLLPLFIGYMVIAFAPSHLTVLTGRFITAIAGGLATAASMVGTKSKRF
jgi:predicted MFS family arabinose efflux permease